MAEMVQLDRYEETIRGYEAYPVKTGKVLLYGSSFLRNWGYERARAQWAQYGGLDVENHGFGGATVDELLRYYHRMVLPYRPSAVVLRSGHNDLTKGLTPEEAWFLTKRLIAWLRTDWPGIPVVILQVFDTKRYANPERRALNARYNEFLIRYAAENQGIFTLDLDPFFHNPDGSLRDIFVEDGLHLTDAAYEEMAAWLTPQVAACLK